MSFERPSLEELAQRTKTDYESRLGLFGKVLRKSFVFVTSRVLAGLAHLLHGHIQWASRQILPDEADERYMRRWASIFGIKPTPAQFAEGRVKFTGSDGSFVDDSTNLVRSDGVEFKTLESGTIDQGQLELSVRALSPGISGNTEDEVLLEIDQPISGVDDEAEVVDGGIVGGSDEEDVESLRSRLLARIRRPPLGGTVDDYQAWALEVPVATRAWVRPLWMGPGTVGVFFVNDNEEDIIPTTAMVEQVEAVIEENRPIPAVVHVMAPNAAEVDFQIAIQPDTSNMREAVTAQLDDLFARDAEPGGTILVSKVHQAIANADGHEDHQLIAMAGENPAVDFEASDGDIPVRGTITWD